jgi:hypothetical protein
LACGCHLDVSGVSAEMPPLQRGEVNFLRL